MFVSRLWGMGKNIRALLIFLKKIKKKLDFINIIAYN